MIYARYIYIYICIYIYIYIYIDTLCEGIYSQGEMA